jgi:flagellar motor component MotA
MNCAQLTTTFYQTENNMNKIAGITLTILSILMAIALGAELKAFIDVPALLIVFGITLGGLISRHGVGGIKQLFDGENNQAPINTVVNSALLAAIIASVVATVVLLTNMGSPKDLGPALAVSMLSTLYAVVIFVVGYAANANAKISISSILLLIGALLVSGLFYIAGFIIAIFMK